MGKKYIGVMSGTSMDAIDAVAIDISNNKVSVLGHCQQSISPQIKQQLLATVFQPITLEQLCRLDQKMAELFAYAIKGLLAHCRIDSSEIIAVGSHGQTVWHSPKTSETPATTLQIADSNLITEITGITTIADFRRRDIAAGGQGAPLAPKFHHYLAGDRDCVAFVNIGGIANISLIEDGNCIGFDCGPGNMLLDIWTQKNLNTTFDNNGEWALQGEVQSEILQQMLQHPYFKQDPPKSTGRELFNLAFIENYAKNLAVKPEDLQATLLQLTVQSIASAIPTHFKQVFICGGGVNNTALMQQLQQQLTTAKMSTTSELGIDPQQLECVAFAWFADRTLNGLTSNLPSVTGAKQQRILGTICLK